MPDPSVLLVAGSACWARKAMRGSKAAEWELTGWSNEGEHRSQDILPTILGSSCWKRRDGSVWLDPELEAAGTGVAGYIVPGFGPAVMLWSVLGCIWPLD